MPKKVKICGLKYPENLREIIRLRPDLIGFIFYKKSPRFVGSQLSETDFLSVPDDVQKVGVFVNADLEEIAGKAQQYKLDMIQLHGDETPDDCRKLKNRGIRLMKAFRIKEETNAREINAFEGLVDYFLFDAPGKYYGGNSETFDWELLKKMQHKTPFFLSGGLGVENIQKAMSAGLKSLAGFDANSMLEIKPGFKDIQLTKRMIQYVKMEQTQKMKHE